MSQDIAVHAAKTASRRQRQARGARPARALTAGRDAAMINPAVFTTTFLAAAVEIIEMVIIVVGVGAIRGWRSTLLGTGAGLAVVAALILALGTALAHVPINGLRVVAGSLLFVFGLQWLRKGSAGSPPTASAAWARGTQPTTTSPPHGADWIAFLLAFRGVVLEGLEVAIIVATFGAAARAFSSAALAAAAALVVIGGAGALARRLVGAHPAQRPATPGRHAAVRLRLLLGGGGARDRVARRRPGHYRPGRLVRPRRRLVHQAAAAADPACQPARSPAREVNHDRFLAQPGGDREPSRARGLRKVSGTAFVIGDDWTVAAAVAAALAVTLAAAHRRRGRLVAAAAGRGGRDRDQPSPHQRRRAAVRQQRVATEWQAAGPDRPHQFASPSAGPAIHRFPS